MCTTSTCTWANRKLGPERTFLPGVCSILNDTLTRVRHALIGTASTLERGGSRVAPFAYFRKVKFP